MIDARAYVTNPAGRYYSPLSGVIGIAIHHSVTWAGLPFAEAASELVEVLHIQTIDAYHVSQGWGGFGYHLASFPSGRFYLCGDLDGARAHVASRNHELRGVVFIGDFTARDPGPAQLAAGAEAVALVRQAAGRPLALAGHRAWALPDYPTSCPGDRLAARLSELEPTPEEDDMPDPVFVQSNGLMAQVGILGAHRIGNPNHAAGLIAGGAKRVEVPDGTIETIPDVVDLLREGK